MNTRSSSAAPMESGGKPTIIFVGGFLGSGKTTLLVKAAARIREWGLRPAIVTNDQGIELVDTNWANAAGFPTEEVLRGCFCCQFSNLAEKIKGLVERGIDVILAEPVGSCADLAATVLRPLSEFQEQALRVAPLTVLVEPRRAAELLGLRDSDPMKFLFQKQLAEADTIWLSKADTGQEPAELSGLGARKLSSYTGEGIDDWLRTVLGGSASATKSLSIDYGVYAEAEAALAWLNWAGEIHLTDAKSLRELASFLVEKIETAATALDLRIAHFKILIASGNHYLKAGVCRNKAEPSFEGSLKAGPASEHRAIVNLRAVAEPNQLDGIVDQALASLKGSVVPLGRESFRPSPPKPEYRVSVAHGD